MFVVRHKLSLTFQSFSIVLSFYLYCEICRFLKSKSEKMHLDPRLLGRNRKDVIQESRMTLLVMRPTSTGTRSRSYTRLGCHV